MSKQIVQEKNKLVTLSKEVSSQIETKKQRRISLINFWQFVRFCIVGSLNAIIDFTLLDLLLWLYPTTSVDRILFFNSLAVLLAATNSFLCNKYWTFRKREPITLGEVGRFAIVAIATAVLNDTLIFLLASLFPAIMNSSLIGANLLKLGAIAGTTSVSFFGMRLWVFFQKRTTGLPSATTTVTSTRIETLSGERKQ